MFKHKFAGKPQRKQIIRMIPCHLVLLLSLKWAQKPNFLCWKVSINGSMKLANIKVCFESVDWVFYKNTWMGKTGTLPKNCRARNQYPFLIPQCLSAFAPHLFTSQLLWTEFLKYLSSPFTSLHTHNHHSCPSQCYLLLQLLSNTIFSAHLVLPLTTLNFALSQGDPYIARQREKQRNHWDCFWNRKYLKFWVKDVLEKKLYLHRGKTNNPFVSKRLKSLELIYSVITSNIR